MLGTWQGTPSPSPTQGLCFLESLCELLMTLGRVSGLCNCGTRSVHQGSGSPPRYGAAVMQYLSPPYPLLRWLWTTLQHRETALW